MSKKLSPVIKSEVNKTMSFAQATLELIAGKKLTRLEWRDADTYILMSEGYLCIHNSQNPVIVNQRLLVSEGDLLGNDWVIIDGGKN